MTVSHWRRAPRPAVVEADLVVVGAGVCGVSAALHAERRGLRVAVVERHGLASGASTRNAGFLMRGAAENYAAAIRDYGRDRARLVWRWTEENLDGLRAEGVAALPSYRAVPSCLLALARPERDELADSVRMLRDDGFAVEWRDSGDDSAWRAGHALGGLVNPADASVNSWDLMRLLAGKLRAPPVEHQEVHTIGPAGAAAVEVATADAVFRAPRVLLCLNAYGPLVAAGLEGVVTPRRGQMMAIRGDGLRLDYSYYANHGYEYFRQTPDGTVVVGGCRKRHAEAEAGYEDRTTPAVQTDLERFAAWMFGSGWHVTARWAGTMGFSPDGLPLIGPVAGAWPPGCVWFCGGFTGHGMSMAYRTSLAAVDSIVGGGPNPFPIDRPMPGATGVTGTAAAASGAGSAGADGGPGC